MDFTSCYRTTLNRETKMFTLKPKDKYHGVSLKKWYRRVYRALGRFGYIPSNWTDHPSVYVPADKLPAVMNQLYSPSFTNYP